MAANILALHFFGGLQCFTVASVHMFVSDLTRFLISWRGAGISCYFPVFPGTMQLYSGAIIILDPKGRHACLAKKLSEHTSLHFMSHCPTVAVH